MNARRIALLIIIVLVALVLASPVRGQGGIIVNNADATATIGVACSSDCAAIPNIGPRFVVQYANGIRYIGVGPISSDLQRLIRQVSARFVIQYANSNRTYRFAYPVGLTCDTTPPQITDITFRSDAIGSATIVWYTDEFADSVVRYSTQSGVYTDIVSDTLYHKLHQVILTDTVPGTTYYYQVSSTDRDGNTATSSENSFVLVGANFTATPTSGPAPLTVAFTNISTGVYTSSLWYFGDGVTSTQANPSHIYGAFGGYTVTLTVSGTGGMDTLTRTNYITAYRPVQAAYTAAPTSGVQPLAVSFTNQSTGDYTTSLWSFGDGVTSTLANPQHNYTTAGTYTVILTVSGPGGTNALTRASYITVYTPAQASFTASSTLGPRPFLVTFTNQSIGDYTSSLWNFGDGTTSTLANPTHTYTSAGTFTITLTVSGPGGTDTFSRANYITVYEPVKADFTASPTLGIPPLAVDFMDSSSGPVATWEWAFGDGATSTLRYPTHIYVTGTYTVSLTVRAADGYAVLPGGNDTFTRSNYIRAWQAVYLPLILRNP
jgi:PKD repeat protein